MDADAAGGAVGGELLEEIGTGVEGEDGRETKLSEGKGLEPGAATKVDGEATGIVWEERRENGALLGYLLLEGEVEHLTPATDGLSGISRAMTMRWISLVPSPMVQSFTSR